MVNFSYTIHFLSAWLPKYCNLVLSDLSKILTSKKHLGSAKYLFVYFTISIIEKQSDEKCTICLKLVNEQVA